MIKSDHGRDSWPPRLLKIQSQPAQPSNHHPFQTQGGTPWGLRYWPIEITQDHHPQSLTQLHSCRMVHQHITTGMKGYVRFAQSHLQLDRWYCDLRAGTCSTRHVCRSSLSHQHRKFSPEDPPESMSVQIAGDPASCAPHGLTYRNPPTEPTNRFQTICHQNPSHQKG